MAKKIVEEMPEPEKKTSSSKEEYNFSKLFNAGIYCLITATKAAATVKTVKTEAEKIAVITDEYLAMVLLFKCKCKTLNVK